MANSNNWGEIYKSTWWGDEDWSANSLKIDSAPPGFAEQNLLLGSEELDQSDVGEWVRLNINAVDANVAGVANPLSSDETVEKVDFQASPTSRIIQDVTLVAGTQYTFSVWAKSASASNEQFRLRYWDRTAASGGGDLFTALTTDWSPTSGRYSFTFTAASSGVHAMHIQNSGSDQRRIYFWGAMLNEGATAGDYIKTEFTPQPSNPPAPPMEFGDNFVGVTAYYSLRRFTTGEDNNAIRVRRSSDDTEQDIGFDSNGDLDTTALTTFVNADITQYNYSTATQMVADFSSVGGADSVDTIGGEEALKFTINASSGTHFPYRFNVFGGGGECSISFDYYIPSTNTDIDGIQMSDATNDIGATQTTQDAWTSVTLTGTLAGESLYIFSKKGTSKSFTGNGTDVFYIKNLVVTQTTADGAVTTFYDQSGNGNNATNATASEQPLVVSAGTLVEENGKAAIDFDGVDDHLSKSSPSLGNSITNLTGFVAAKYDATGLFASALYGATNSVNYPTSGSATIGRQLSGNDTFVSNNSGGFANPANAGASTLNQTLFYHQFIGGTEVAIGRNGGSLNKNVSGIPANLDLTLKLEIGGITVPSVVNPMNGKIQEIILFDSNQSGNRTNMETNINDHFSIYP